MVKDDIVEEIRLAREQNAVKWKFDLKAILADARKRQANSGHRIVAFDAKKKKTP
jgi:hypothetical protein